MEQNQIWGFVLILIGALNLYLGYKAIKDPKFALNYAQSSPKAWIWRKIFGVDKTVKLMKNVFAPIGAILGIALVIGGVYLLFV